MGCWNHTDMISRLHVTASEEVVSLFLVENPWVDQGSLCYSSSFYNPIPVLLYGEYNDYGAVEDFTGKFDDVLLAVMKENLFEFEQGENASHDIPTSRDSLDLETLYKYDHEGRLAFVNPFKHYESKTSHKLDKLYVHHVVIKKSLFDSILNSWSFDTWWTVGLLTYEQLCEGIEESVIKLRKTEDKLGDRDLQSVFKRAGVDDNLPFMCRILSRGGTNSGEFNIHVSELLRSLPEDRAIDFMREYLKFCWLSLFVSLTRTTWMPQTGKGSQNAEGSGYNLLAGHLLSEPKREETEFDED